MNRRYTLGVLLLVYVLSFVDRQIISILAQSIKEDLVLTDTELGLLTGVAFALLYAVLGIPVARLAERVNRVPILSVCIFLWSAMTAAGAATHNFLQLALTRAGVGVGEAGSVAPAHSMISDMYAPDERSHAMGIFQLGAPIGVLLGFLVGGVLAHIIGWRHTLFWVGISGIFVALLVQCTITDPRRALNLKSREIPAGERVHFWSDMRALFALPSYRWLCVGTMLAAGANYSIVSFLPAYILRTFDHSLSTVGIYLSLIIGLGGGIGLFFGGWLGDQLARAGIHRSLLVSACSMLSFAPLICAAILFGDDQTIYLYLVLPFLVSNAWQGAAFAQIQTVAPLGIRATASAVVLLFNNLLGLGLGPLIIGISSDWLHASAVASPLAMALMIVPVMAILSGLAYWVAMRIVQREQGPAATRTAPI